MKLLMPLRLEDEGASEFETGAVAMWKQLTTSVPFPEKSFDLFSEELYLAFQKMLIGKCKGHSFDEEDLWATFLFRLVRYRDSVSKVVETGGSLRAFFIVMITNIAHDLVKDEQKRARLQSSSLENVENFVATKDASPEQKAILSERLKMLHKALKVLRPEDRRVLRYTHTDKPKTTARILGMEPYDYRRAVYAAERRLRTVWINMYGLDSLE